MKISPHLCFDGQCEEAFGAYRRILGGTIATMLRYGDSPMAPTVASEHRGRILHATLLLGDVELTGVDLLPDDFRMPQGFFVTLTFAQSAEGQRVFQQLAEGGIVRLPFAATFWSPGFGVLIDRFGTPWEVNTEGTLPPN
ncbi:MAG TPA: VOC family protein [Chthonomonadaceae bacterium]|nr:VOC family protein [Chthonomonadaceae bacterium]